MITWSSIRYGTPEIVYVMNNENDFDAQSKHLNEKIAELSSALDAAHDDSEQLRHRVAELETGMVRHWQTERDILTVLDNVVLSY